MPTIGGADAYFANTLRADKWSVHTAGMRGTAIKEAASMLSRLSFAAQPPATAMDNATYEQAYCLLETSIETQQRMQAIASGLKSFSAGKQSESYQDADKVALLKNGMMLCPMALSWIDQYIRKMPVVKSGRLLSGGDRYRPWH